ncbi:MAG: hypothetical protein DHS20C03_08790 [Minwuia thermotolerans]|nr:MAG: hypothetical protein DHS20C03_08790 [Minwuia thermotolerans]
MDPPTGIGREALAFNLNDNVSSAELQIKCSCVLEVWETNVVAFRNQAQR